MNPRPTRHPTRTLAALSLCMALQMTGFVMVLPLFARRFESFGAGMEALGISSMAYALTSMLAAPFIGALADRFGRRPVILVSLSACILAFGGFLLAGSSLALILLRGAAGLCTAGLIPAIASSAGDLASEDRRAQWMGILGGGASVGWILGPLLGGLLYDRFGYVIPFASAIAMTAAALLLAASLVPETFKESAAPGRPQKSGLSRFRTLAASPAFFMLMLVSFGVAFAWAFIEPQFMFYTYEDLNWSSSQLGLAMSTYGVACMAGEFALGGLSDRFGRKPVLVLGLALFSAQFLGLVMFRQAAWIVAGFILAGLGNAIFDPALSAFILDITPSEHKAGSLGLKNMLASLGNLLGPALVVLVAPFVGPRLEFLISACLVFGLAGLSVLSLRKPQVRDAGLEPQPAAPGQNWKMEENS